MDITHQTETAGIETTQATGYTSDRSATLMKHIIALDDDSPSRRMEAFVALAAAGVIHRPDNNSKETGVYSEASPEHWIMAQWNLDKLEAVHREQFRTQLIAYLCASEAAAVQEKAASLLPLLEQRLLLHSSNPDNVTNKAELLRVSIRERVRVDNLLKVLGTDAHSSRQQETPASSRPFLAMHSFVRTALRPLATLRTLWNDWLGGLEALTLYAIVWLVTLVIDIAPGMHRLWVTLPFTLLMYSLMGKIAAIGFEANVQLGVAQFRYRVRRIVTLIACLPLFWLAFR